MSKSSKLFQTDFGFADPVISGLDYHAGKTVQAVAAAKKLNISLWTASRIATKMGIDETFSREDVLVALEDFAKNSC
jgi:hypothetical protein